MEVYGHLCHRFWLAMLIRRLIFAASYGEHQYYESLPSVSPNPFSLALGILALVQVTPNSRIDAIDWTIPHHARYRLLHQLRLPRVHGSGADLLYLPCHLPRREWEGWGRGAAVEYRQ